MKVGAVKMGHRRLKEGSSPTVSEGVQLFGHALSLTVGLLPLFV